MVGAVLLTYAFIARELIATVEYLVGKVDGIVAVSIDVNVDVFKARTRIWRAMKEVDQGDGVLIMTDLFGGFPSNIAFSFLGKQKAADRTFYCPQCWSWLISYPQGGSRDSIEEDVTGDKWKKIKQRLAR